MRRSALFCTLALMVISSLTHAQQPPKLDLPPEELASLSQDGRTLLRKLQFAVKDLTRDQAVQALNALKPFDAELKAMREKHEEMRQATLDQARATGTPIDMKADQTRRAARQELEARVEAQCWDAIGQQALKPPQRLLWDAYHLHAASAFQLSFTGLPTESLRKLEPTAQAVAKEVNDPSLPPRQLFLKRLDELQERAAATLMDDAQRAKYAKIKASREQSRKDVEALLAAEPNP